MNASDPTSPPNSSATPGGPRADLFLPALPVRIGEFSVVRRLGHGTSGTVYLAQQAHPERLVALKLLAPALPGAEHHQRLEREASLLARVEHPNIARLYAIGSSGTADLVQPYLVMEWVPGASLTEHVRQHTLRLAQRVELVVTLARAVHYMHTLGIVHRDLKPDNVMVNEAGVPKILDFGVACASGPDALPGLTLPGQVVGTLHYMAPEQLAATELASTPQVDIYALGMMAYEVLTGTLPYQPASFRTVITAANTLRDVPPELQPGKTGLPPDLAAVLAKALHGNHAQRYATMLEFALDLERFLQREPVLARPPGVLHRLRLRVLRQPVQSAAITFSLLALVGTTALSTRYALQEAAQKRQIEAHSTEIRDSTRFLQEMLSGGANGGPHTPDLRMHDVLLNARTLLESPGHFSPVVVVRAKLFIGNTLNNLFDREIGANMVLDAAAQAEQTPGFDADVLADARVYRLIAQYTLGQNAEAEQGARALLAVPAGQSEAEHSRWKSVRETLVGVLSDTGRPREALDLQVEKEAHQTAWRETSQSTITYDLQTRADLYFQLAKFTPLFELARDHGDEYAQRFGQDSPGVQQLFNTAAIAARELGQDQLAVKWITRFTQSMRTVHGKDNIFTRMAESKLFYLQHLLAPNDPRPLQALTGLQQTLERAPNMQPWVKLDTRINLDAARLTSPSGDLQRAALKDLELLDREVRAGTTERSPQTLRARLILAQRLGAQGRPEAAAVFAPLCEDMRRMLVAGHLMTQRCELGVNGGAIDRQR